MSSVFNAGLARKAFRELLPVTIGFGTAIFFIEFILAYALPTFQKQFSQQMMQLPFLQTMIKAMVGADTSASIGPALFTSIAWVHPVVLAMCWAHAIIAFTRVPAGEVDAGTIDVLMGWPVSRTQVFLTETIMLVLGGAAMMVLVLAGNTMGSRFVAPEFRPEFSRVVITLANLFGVYLVVGSFAWLVGTLLARRGRAMTIAFVACLVSFLLNYLAQLWKPAEHLVFLSVMNYHRPIAVLERGIVPTRDLLVLVAAALVFWTSTWMVFRRRDLMSV
jgi:putative exporter of polyketide antibiotics